MDPSDICFEIRLLSQGRDVMGADMMVDMMMNNKVSDHVRDHWNILDKVSDHIRDHWNILDKVWAILVVWDMAYTHMSHMVCIHLS